MNWRNFPKADTFPGSSRGVRRSKRFFFPSLSSLCSPAPAWPSPRKWVTPKLAECLVGTKINLPSLSSPPLASVPSVLALISSPGDESLGSWGGRLCRAQSSFDSCPEPYGQCHCVHMCGCASLHVTEALCQYGCEESGQRRMLACGHARQGVCIQT